MGLLGKVLAACVEKDGEAVAAFFDFRLSSIQIRRQVWFRHWRNPAANWPIRTGAEPLARLLGILVLFAS